MLADPNTQQAIDGTGWVRESLDGKRLTDVGQVFRMAMYHSNYGGMHYEIANRVEVFEPPHAIAWLPGQGTDDGNLRLRRLDLALRPQAGHPRPDGGHADV